MWTAVVVIIPKGVVHIFRFGLAVALQVQHVIVQRVVVVLFNVVPAYLTIPQISRGTNFRAKEVREN